MSRLAVALMFVLMQAARPSLALTEGSHAQFVPQAGFVPDKATAVAVAEAVMTPVYGRELVMKERPFHAELIGDVWTVTGFLPSDMLGGVAVVKMSRKDCKILSMSHSR